MSDPYVKSVEVSTKPDACPSCNATLTDVPFEGDACPHCGYDLVANERGFGAREWKFHPARLRDTDPQRGFA